MGLTPHFPVRHVRVVLRIPEILRLCADKKVLHLGCADMPYILQRGENLLHKCLVKVTGPDMLWGLDVSEEGIRMLSEMGFTHVIHGDVERMRAELQQVNFDIILAGEIIEHLANPGNFLKSITSIMSKKTELVLTTPNAFAFKGFLHSMLRREKVHPDHNYYFSYRTIRQLLEKFDLQCKEIYYYQEVEGHGMSRALDNAIWYTTWISPVYADGLIVRATI